MAQKTINKKRAYQDNPKLAAHKKKLYRLQKNV